MSAIILTCGSQSITLRPPEFENQESVSLSRINRKTRGGDLIIFRDPVWPKDMILKLPFVYLSQGQVNRLLAFLNFSLGKDVTITTHEGQSFVGVITNPSGNIAQPGRENFTAEIDFQLNQDQF